MAPCANPIPSKVAKSPLKVERKVMCADYQGCLDKAVKRKWAGFSCRKCRAYSPIQFDSTEWLADSLACLALMYVAGFGALTLVQLIVALFSALVGSTFTSVVLLGCLWKRTTREGGIAGMIGGFVIAWIWHFAKSPLGLNPVIPGVIVSGLLTIGVSLFTPLPPKEALEPFFKPVRTSDSSPP